MRCLGIDIGKQQDPSASVITEGDWRLPIRIVKASGRIKLGTDYGAQTDHLIELAAHCDMVLVDCGGPGWPIVDAMRRRGVPVWAVAITSGKTLRMADNLRSVFVPKHNLIGIASLVIEKNCLEMDGEHQSLTDELSRFEQNGVKMEAAEGHDDLVMALAISLLGFHVERLNNQ